MNEVNYKEDKQSCAQATLEAMEKKLSPINDTKMRSNRFHKLVSELDTSLKARLLELIYLSALKKKWISQFMLQSLVDDISLYRAFGREDLADIYREADHLGFTFATEFLSPMPSGKLQKAIKEGHQDLSNLTLGEKKSLARGCAPNLIEKLLIEPEPMVIANLLDHPRILEHQVLQIASKQPNFPAVLKVIFKNRRWQTRYQVKKALLQNPYSPPRMVMALLPTLSTPDVKFLKRSRRFSHHFIDKILAAMEGREEQTETDPDKN